VKKSKYYRVFYARSLNSSQHERVFPGVMFTTVDRNGWIVEV